MSVCVCQVFWIPDLLPQEPLDQFKILIEIVLNLKGVFAKNEIQIEKSATYNLDRKKSI